MSRLLLVSLGGAIGSGARFLIANLARAWFGTTFPFGTLVVNVLGSFLIGVIMHLGLAGDLVTPNARLFLTTGILGGFTTYSAFNYETCTFAERGAFALALANVALTLVLCLLAGFAGAAAGRMLARA